MATAKTPKKTPAAKPVAKPVPAARAAAPKRVPARAAAKPVEEAVVKSVEIVAEPPAKAPEPVVEAVAKAVEPVVEKTVEAVKEVAAKPAKAVAIVKKTAEDAQDSMIQGVISYLDFGRDNAILLVATGNQLALGLHKLSQSLIDWSAESCDKSVAAGQAMLSAKTVEEILDLSQSLAKDGFDQVLKEGAELSALSSKLIEDTIVPLPGRLVAAVEKLASHAA